MKKLSLLFVSSALILSLFVSCKHETPKINYIGEKVPGTYALGDVVYPDGSADSSTNSEKIELNKDKAIAIIVRPTTKDEKALGIGLEWLYENAWCDSNAITLSKKYFLNIAGQDDVDGSDNFDLLKTAFSSEEDDISLYPIFERTKKNYPGCFLPSLMDLAYLSSTQKDVDILGAYKAFKTLPTNRIVTCNRSIDGAYMWNCSITAIDPTANLKVDNPMKGGNCILPFKVYELNNKADGPFIGSKTPAEKYSNGDIVYKDGSHDPISMLSDAVANHKADAEAIVFSEKGYASKNGAMAMCLTYSDLNMGLAWCTTSAKAYETALKLFDSSAEKINNEFSPSCKISGEILFDLITTPEFDIKVPSIYPVLYHGKNYKLREKKIIGTDYETDWYIPSYGEILNINTEETWSAVKESLQARGDERGTQLSEYLSDGHYFWTSTFANDQKLKNVFRYQPGKNLFAIDYSNKYISIPVHKF